MGDHENTAAVLDEFGVKYDKAVISAHRMPEEMMAFAKDAVDNGIEVIIAGGWWCGPSAGNGRC